MEHSLSIFQTITTKKLESNGFIPNKIKQRMTKLNPDKTVAYKCSKTYSFSSIIIINLF